VTGFFGLTISTGKGLLLYSPPVLLALAGWRVFFRRWWADALLCLGIVAAHFAFYSRLSAWHGDGSWGPRYLMVMLPFAVVPLVVVLDGLRARPIRLAAVTAIVGAGVVIQLLGLLVNFDWYIVRSNQNARFFTPAASPILIHARILGERVSLWQGRFFPPSDSAVMVGGFYAAEPPPERPTTRPGLYPRWTDGDGEIVLHPAAQDSLTVKLTFFEDRPPALRTERPTVLINGAALAESAVTREDLTGDSGGWIYQFTVPTAAIVGGETRVTLHSTTWNPHQAGRGDRDEMLGVFVHNVEVWQGGRAFAVTEALPIDPMPQTPRQRFWWHNDDRNYWDLRRHLVDHWGWYLAVAGFPRGGAIAWAATYGGGALALLLAGILLGRGYLPAPQTRRVGKRRRAASRKGISARTGKRIA
jgi:hypothetical protein